VKVPTGGAPLSVVPVKSPANYFTLYDSSDRHAISKGGRQMKRLLATVLVFALTGATRADDIRTSIPPSVISDPVADAAHPPRSAQVLVPSHGMGMNALFYLAAGTGPHPTMVLLHGFPGNEQNLDLAQAIRRAGWNVLTLHYRGAWGSPGIFSIGHVLEDADAAITFVRRPDIVEKFGIDTRRIVLGGHSMGGFASAAHARSDERLLGVVLVDAWNVGATGQVFARANGAARAALVAKEFDDLGNSLHGATAESTAEEIMAHRTDWDFESWAKDLTRPPLLVIGASKAFGDENRRLAEAVTRAGGRVTAVTLPSDHNFQDHRIALAAEVVNWLMKLPGL
jgi:pimeloyl-ACP methyl ester carboxylesterase